MPRKYTIRPVRGRRVIDPQTDRVVTDDITVDASFFWDRRIKDGDVEEVPAKTPISVPVAVPEPEPVESKPARSKSAKN